MICKGRHNFGEGLTQKQAIAAYLSDRTMCPIDYYDDKTINEVIHVAALDYIDHLKKPSAFIRQIDEALRIHNNPLMHASFNVDYYEAVCIAFSLAPVRGENYFKDGFVWELTYDIEKEN